ncbi:ABC transporter ATP-binding protein [Lentibacter algarum]|uniref:ABC transporter ATP-binding protein n=1 Tax=Lentibacter algarum TaxID=576131 RepID=UPI001C06FBF8|nr:ABC transporter ATP-binding protein [Lentibacter algarum]MBU2980647.1 ABC transporter ATP-binding protein [Lentibacter algarum]
MAFLSIENLNAFYGKAQALHDVSLSCEKGEIIAVIGANGAGKSTLLDSIMGLTKTTGTISFDGTPLNGGPAAAVERGIGYGPERFNLFPYMSVYDNLMVGAFTARNDIEKNLAAVFRLFPRLEERQAQETSTQSGGERQMVSLGRALMTSPRLLIVDEPTIGLAPKVCTEIAAALRRLRDDMGLTILITEQNANFAMTLAERLYVLEAGAVRATGTVDELRDDPRLLEAYFGH